MFYLFTVEFQELSPAVFRKAKVISNAFVFGLFSFV